MNFVHTKKVNTATNEIRRIITVYLKPTKEENLYMRTGIAPPQIRSYIEQISKGQKRQLTVDTQCAT